MHLLKLQIQLRVSRQSPHHKSGPQQQSRNNRSVISYRYITAQTTVSIWIKSKDPIDDFKCAWWKWINHTTLGSLSRPSLPASNSTTNAIPVDEAHCCDTSWSWWILIGRHNKATSSEQGCKLTLVKLTLDLYRSDVWIQLPTELASLACTLRYSWDCTEYQYSHSRERICVVDMHRKEGRETRHRFTTSPWSGADGQRIALTTQLLSGFRNMEDSPRSGVVSPAMSDGSEKKSSE